MTIRATDKVYFVFSEIQVSENKEINKRISKGFDLGEVSVEKNIMKYSKIILQSELENMKAQYPDTKIVAAGEFGKMKFTPIVEDYLS